MKGERQQRELLAALGVMVERERMGKGSHRVLYCVGPRGERFVMTTSLLQRPDPMALRAFEKQVRQKLST